MSIRSDLISAAMLLTRLPVRGNATPRAADAAWAWPLAGGLVGVLAAGAGLFLLQVGAAPEVVATSVLALLVAMTGALHEDGLADVADGFWGAFDPARRLEIMRDSRIGTYGVVALVLSLLLRWSLIGAAVAQGQLVAVVIAAAIASRAPMAVAMRILPPARADGLSKGAGAPPGRAIWVGLAMAAVALLAHGPRGLLAAGLVALAVAGLLRLARARIGGQTGDVLGAVQQVSEIVVLVALTSG